jgi:hypothetical protein
MNFCCLGIFIEQSDPQESAEKKNNSRARFLPVNAAKMLLFAPHFALSFSK